MKQDKPFHEAYAIDASTNFYMIEIGLDQYADIFNEWDPVPFKRRCLDPDLEIYLERSSEEIPFRHPIELCFIVPAKIQNEHLEEETCKGLKNNFSFKLYLFRKELEKTNFRMVLLILAGFVLLGIAAVFSDRVAEAFVLSTLVEGLFIAGWVFLWEAVSLFFFTNREVYHRYRTYKRLQNALVIFQHPKDAA